MRHNGVLRESSSLTKPDRGKVTGASTIHTWNRRTTAEMKQDMTRWTDKTLDGRRRRKVRLFSWKRKRK